MNEEKKGTGMSYFTKEEYIESMPTVIEQYNFKSLIFVSDISNTIYLWNGEETICIRMSIDSSYNEKRKTGQIMKGFKKVDFNKIYNNNSAHFQIENATYIILNKV